MFKALESCSSTGVDASSAITTASSRISGLNSKSIPDHLALVGDAADGYPGLPRWAGAKSASAVLARFGFLEAIPPNPQDWHVNVSHAQNLSKTLNSKRDLVYVFRDHAILRTNLPVFASADNLLWQGPAPAFAPLAERFQKAVFAKKRLSTSRAAAKNPRKTHYV